MLNETGEEQMIPQPQDDLSTVEPYLKILPNPKTGESLIDVYYQVCILYVHVNILIRILIYFFIFPILNKFLKKVYRHCPHLKKKIVLDCFKSLSNPQQFLLLNCVFFAASPFHPDPNLRDGKIYHQVFTKEPCFT